MLDENFWQGFEKSAKKKEEKHRLARLAFGAPLVTAYHAPKGKKLKGFGESYVNALKKSLTDMGIGTGVGAAGGALVGALSKGRIRPGQAAILGGIGGANVGNLSGLIRGNFGKDSDKILEKYKAMAKKKKGKK